MLRNVAASVGPIVVLAAVLCCFVGCSPERHYKVMSFFFDGVPDPNAPVVNANDTTSATAAAVHLTGSVHKPYGDNKCDACHGENTGAYEDFQKLDAGTCLNCHGNITHEYNVMHGPVSAMQCLFCHSPHESSEKNLLVDTPQKLCTKCHIPELLPTNPPQHVMPDVSCLDCHSGHGGAKHGLLIARADTTAPSAAGAATPSTNPSNTDNPAGEAPR